MQPRLMPEEVRCQWGIVARQQWVPLACVRQENGKRTMCLCEQRHCTQTTEHSFVNYLALGLLADLSETGL
jgi:hypothetical protein